MSSLESIKTNLADLVKKSSKYEKRGQDFEKRFLHDLYHTFFNLISDPKHSPESIMYLIETFVSQLGRDLKNYFQSFVAFACFEGLAKRRPTLLNGPWETLVWVLGKHSLPLIIGWTNMPHWHGYYSNAVTIKFIMDYSLPELCPNPFLRLELIKLITVFNFKCDEVNLDKESLRKNIINFLVETCDKYISLSQDQVPNLCPQSLQFIMIQFGMNMRYIANNYDIQLRRSKIIPSFLKLSRKYSLLGMVKPKNCDDTTIGRDSWFDNIQGDMTACISFCGLIPEKEVLSYSGQPRIECLEDMIQEVGSDSLLKNYVIDILDSMSQMSLSFPWDVSLSNGLLDTIDKLYDGFVESHIKQYPTLQCRYEMDGGIRPAEEYRMRYFRSNGTGELTDSDSDSEEIIPNYDQDSNDSNSGPEEMSD